jgi:hypothetical protein
LGDEKFIKEICLLYFYKEVYYNQLDKLSNKYWYSQFDSSKSDIYKIKAKEKYDNLKIEIENYIQDYINVFVHEYVIKNNLNDELIFNSNYCSMVGKLKPAKFDNRINVESFIEHYCDVYREIRYEYYDWSNNLIEKRLKDKEEFLSNPKNWAWF